MWFCTIVDVQLTKLSKSTTFVVQRNQTCLGNNQVLPTEPLNLEDSSI